MTEKKVVEREGWSLSTGKKSCPGGCKGMMFHDSCEPEKIQQTSWKKRFGARKKGMETECCTTWHRKNEWEKEVNGTWREANATIYGLPIVHTCIHPKVLRRRRCMFVYVTPTVGPNTHISMASDHAFGQVKIRRLSYPSTRKSTCKRTEKCWRLMSVGGLLSHTLPRKIWGDKETWMVHPS